MFIPTAIHKASSFLAGVANNSCFAHCILFKPPLIPNKINKTPLHSDEPSVHTVAVQYGKDFPVSLICLLFEWLQVERALAVVYL